MAKKIFHEEEIKENLNEMSNEKLFNRYLEPADASYDPNDNQFLTELLAALRQRGDNGKYKFLKIIGLMKVKGEGKYTQCYTNLFTVLYVDALQDTVKYGYKLNLTNILTDIEALLETPENMDWQTQFSIKKQTASSEFDNIVNFVCLELIKNRALDVLVNNF